MTTNHHRLAAGIIIGGLLFGWGATVQASSSHKASSSSRVTPAMVSSQGTPAGTNFPQDMQGTWYTADGATLTIHGNQLQTDDGHGHTSTLEAHPAEQHTDADTNHHPQTMQADTVNWCFLTNVTMHHHRWLREYGWTQSRGDGTLYRVTKWHHHKELLRSDDLSTMHYFRSAHAARVWEHHHH